VKPGSRVGPFRIERLIAAGASGSVYEATQPSLGRAVALRLIEAERFAGPRELEDFDRRQRMAAAINHASLVSFYEAGEWEGGRFVATRLIRGRPLAELCDEGAPPPAEALQPLADALRTIHSAGAVHGSVSAENILVAPDGTPHLADLGLRPPGSAEADTRALAAVVSGLPSRAEKAGTARAGRRAGLALLAAAAVAAAILAVAIGDSGSDSVEGSVPDPSPGTVPVGSDLAPTATEELGCGEAAPTPNTPACTIAQASVVGRPVEVRRAGVIRSWAVRGASGDLALQVIRERGGRSFVAGFSQPESLTGPGPRAFPADIAVRSGDMIGVELAPGASIGVRPGSGSELVRWDGGLTVDVLARPDLRLEGQIMLRADVEPGARPDRTGQLLGERAASAPNGETLDETVVSLPRVRATRAAVVELPGEIAVDVLRRGRRLARVVVPDADPDGEPIDFVQFCRGPAACGFLFLWRNPGEQLPLTHAYTVQPSGRITLLG
jgi:hypothetical protein